MRKTGYTLLPHTTDAYIEAVGVTLEEAMQFAGIALIDTICNVNSVSPVLTEHIEASGDDEVALLYDWLESILLKFELERWVFSDIQNRSDCEVWNSLSCSGAGFWGKI